MRVAAPPDARRVAGLRRRVRARGEAALSGRAPRHRARGSGPSATSTSSSTSSWPTASSAAPASGPASSRCSRHGAPSARRDASSSSRHSVGALRARSSPTTSRSPRPPGSPRVAVAAARSGARPEPHARDDLGCLPGRLGVRRRPRDGRPRHAPRAPDRGQVAALHARVRPRAARARGHGAHPAGRRAPGPPRGPARPARRRGAGPRVRDVRHA